MTKDSRISVRIEEEHIKALEVYADRIGISPSQLYRNLILVGLDDLKVMDKLGVIFVAGTVRGIKETLQRKAQVPYGLTT